MCGVARARDGTSTGAGGIVIQQPAGGLPGNAAWWAAGVVLGHCGAGTALLCAAHVRPRRGDRVHGPPCGPGGPAPRCPQRRRGHRAVPPGDLGRLSGAPEEMPSAWSWLRPWRRGSGSFSPPGGPLQATGSSLPMRGALRWSSDAPATSAQCAAGPASRPCGRWGEGSPEGSTKAPPPPQKGLSVPYGTTLTSGWCGSTSGDNWPRTAWGRRNERLPLV